MEGQPGQACPHSGDLFMLLHLQPSAKTYTLHRSRKALFKGMKHTNSDHLHWNYRAWAITPLCFSPPTFINFFVSCDVAHMRKDTRLSPLFRTASDEKLGGAWERGYFSVLIYFIEHELVC